MTVRRATSRAAAVERLQAAHDALAALHEHDLDQCPTLLAENLRHEARRLQLLDSLAPQNLWR